MFAKLCLISVALLSRHVQCQHNLHTADSVQTASSSSWPYGQQSTGGEFHVHNRQGTSLGVAPMLSFLPILILCGVGALILIPLMFLLFSNPMTGLGGFGGFPGAVPFGRKRSISDSMLTDSKFLETIASVSSAIERQMKKYEKKSP